MATDLEKLVVQLDANVKKLETAFNRASGITNTKMSQIERRTSVMARRVEQAMNGISFQGLNSALAGVGAALGVREIAAYADEWTRAGNLIRSAATSAGVEVRSLNELKDSANAARTSLADYSDLYARLIRSASAVASSESEIALATDLISKAFKAGGASAQEQAAGILQIGQALGSGVLQGDELRSLRENAPILAQAIATEFKTTIAGLKQLGADGKLTSDRVFKAILNAQKPIEAQFKATNTTIADAFTRINNEFLAYIGNADASAGASSRLVEALQYVADNFKGVADAAVNFATILIGALTGRAVAGLVVGFGSAVTALGSLLTALRTGVPIAASFSAALGPIGLLAGAAAAAVLLLYHNMDSGDRAAASFSDAIKSNEAALNNAAHASRNYQAELVKQIGLQLEAAKATATQADVAFDGWLEKSQALRSIGLEFAPIESFAAAAKQTAQNAGKAVYELEKQKKRAEEILASSPSGYGKGMPTVADGGKKGQSKRTPAERFDRDLQNVTDRTAALVAETEAMRQLNPLVNDYGYAIEKARTEQELLNAAEKAGVAITPELRAQIAQTAEQWSVASVEAAKLAEAQDRVKESAQEMAAFQKEMVGGIIDGFLSGASAAEVLTNALGKVADKLIEIGLNSIFDSNAGGFNILSFLGFKNGGLPKFANGTPSRYGVVRGPGTGRSDSILARISNGEFITNAKSTQKYRALLEAINEDRVPAFASGTPSLRAPSMPVLRSPQAAQGNGMSGVHVTLGWSKDADGNIAPIIRDVTQKTMKQGFASYEKGSAVRTARDLGQVSSRGYAR